MNNDLISRKWLTDAIRNRRTYLSYEDAKDVIDLIDNAPTVELTELCKGCKYLKDCETCDKNERPQGEILYPGKFIVDNSGISVIVSVDENGIATAKTLLPKSAFVEAYNKYIKEGTK